MYSLTASLPTSSSRVQEQRQNLLEQFQQSEVELTKVKNQLKSLTMGDTASFIKKRRSDFVTPPTWFCSNLRFLPTGDDTILFQQGATLWTGTVLPLYAIRRSNSAHTIKDNLSTTFSYIRDHSSTNPTEVRNQFGLGEDFEELTFITLPEISVGGEV